MIPKNTDGNAFSSQPFRGAAVTKSDSTTFDPSTLYVGGTGDVAVTTKGGDVITLTAVPAGSFIPVLVTQVRSTNTTATNIVRLA